jgi:alpha-L-fucosidase
MATNVRPTMTQPAAASVRHCWFAAARFGMFIHWGLYSLVRRGEWIFHRERWTMREYAKLARRFTARRYDPKARQQSRRF